VSAKRRVDEAFFFIKRASVAKLVGNIRQHETQNLVAAPRLRAPMHRFVVRILCGSMCHCAPVLRIHSTASSTRRLVCVQDGRRQYALLENVSGCVPIARR